MGKWSRNFVIMDYSIHVEMVSVQYTNSPLFLKLLLGSDREATVLASWMKGQREDSSYGNMLARGNQIAEPEHSAFIHQHPRRECKHSFPGNHSGSSLDFSLLRKY